MPEHPFTASLLRKFTGVILSILAMSIQWGLLVVYSGMPVLSALTDSILSVGLLALAGYFGWYLITFAVVWQAQIILAVLIQAICLGLSYSILSLCGIEDQQIFIKSIPLRFLFGLLCWIILLQWYWMHQKLKPEKEEIGENEEKERQEQAKDKPAEQYELIDRISVKDGARIHIVHLHDLFCIQASGDYVTLFTPSGQYIKEQTMKYFEKHLPATFVRIHRSSIINTEYIVRVELFGKESCQVRLKNGISLKASGSGYKLLKERLNI